MNDAPDEEQIISGQGYANLTDDSSFKGRITVTPNWVTIRNGEARYTVPRRRIDFINWKQVGEMDE